MIIWEDFVLDDWLGPILKDCHLSEANGSSVKEDRATRSIQEVRQKQPYISLPLSDQDGRCMGSEVREFDKSIGSTDAPPSVCFGFREEGGDA